MAKATMPLFSVEASGSLGGLEYKRGIYGNVVSRRSISSNRSSPAQLTNRAKFGRAQGYWAGLSDADRAAWNSVLLSPADLKAAVIACYQRFPSVAYYPIRPDPIPSWDVGFRSAVFTWDPAFPYLLVLALTMSGPAQCLANIFTRHLPYPGASCASEQLKFGAFAYPLATRVEITLGLNTPAMRIHVDAIARDNGVLLDTWDFDITQSPDEQEHFH